MPDTGVASLVAAGALETVEPDRDLAALDLEDARNHLRSAERLLADDPLMAYTAVYDAARKAVAAHMRTAGLRVRGKVGFHVKTMKYAQAALGGEGLDDDLERLDDIRTVRNDLEYAGRRVGRAEVEADLETARRVVAAVERLLLER
jgi:hypothetical protein